MPYVRTVACRCLELGYLEPFSISNFSLSRIFRYPKRTSVSFVLIDVCRQFTIVYPQVGNLESTANREHFFFPLDTINLVYLEQALKTTS